MHYTPSRISSRLWQGSAPPEGGSLARTGVDVLVLTEKEHQPGASTFDGVTVLHAPLDDDDRPPTASEAAIVEEAARGVAKCLDAGKRVLVTCWMGRNRSGLICARVLMLRDGLTADRAVRVVKANRGRIALTNPHFVDYLKSVDA